MTFQDWIGKLIAERFDNKKARLAEAMQIDPAVLSHGITVGTFSIDNLLKLAEIAEQSVLDVLRLAKKGETADRIETLQRLGLFPVSSTSATQTLTAAQRKALGRWARLAPNDQAFLLVVMERFAASAPERQTDDAQTRELTRGLRAGAGRRRQR